MRSSWKARPAHGGNSRTRFIAALVALGLACFTPFGESALSAMVPAAEAGTIAPQLLGLTEGFGKANKDQRKIKTTVFVGAPAPLATPRTPRQVHIRRPAAAIVTEAVTTVTEPAATVTEPVTPVITQPATIVPDPVTSVLESATPAATEAPAAPATPATPAAPAAPAAATTRTFCLTGLQVGRFDAIDENGVTLKLRGTRAMGGLTTTYRLRVEGPAAAGFAPGQRISLFGPNGSTVLAGHALTEAALAGRATGNDHLVLLDRLLMIDLAGLPPLSKQVVYTPSSAGTLAFSRLVPCN